MPMRHQELQRLVVDAALALGFHVHTCDMRTGTSLGFPDLVIIARRDILWRELKVPPDTLRPAQKATMYRLQALRANWAIWTPADWESGQIEEELEGVS